MRIVCVSDTHNSTPTLPDGDILIHAGDLTERGYRVEVYRQLGWLELNRQRYQEVILVPGNHDIYFEEHWERAQADCDAADIRLLHNAGIVVGGLHIYGSAHTPNYHSWAFMLEGAALAWAWDRIPAELDVLITHGPPAGILDDSYRGGIGCPLLREAIEMKPPRFHVFGHAHAGRGIQHTDATTFVNTACGVTVIDVEPREIPG